VGNASDRIREAGRLQINTKLGLGSTGHAREQQEQRISTSNDSTTPSESAKLDWIYDILPSGQGTIVADLVSDLVDIASAAARLDVKALRQEYSGLSRFRYKMNRAIWTNLTGQYYLLLFAVVTLALLGGGLYASVTGEVCLSLPDAPRL